MRRLTAISAFAFFLAVPLWAQHGGGHAGGGHGGAGFGGGHAGFSGGHSGGFSGGHASGVHVLSGARPGSMASRGFTRPSAYSQRSFSRDPYLNRGFRGDRFRGGNRGRFHTYGFGNNCYGYPCAGYGYGNRYPWGAGYYDPWLWDWWDSGSTYDQDDPSQDVAAAAEMNRQNLEEQRMLRQEEADGDQDLYARADPAARPITREADGAPVLPDTVLVFRDQHRQEVRNYAIVGQTLWNFSQQRTEKIPLSELDLPATAKANDERGLTFRVPASGEAQ